ncbi:MAG: hypothetical protein R6V10_10445 [bacterium]
MERSLLTRAILTGGIASGVLSGIPLLGYPNCCCCCIWYIMGGMIASYVVVYYSPFYPSDGSGALAGLGAGALCGLINSIMNMLFQLVSPSQLDPETIEPFLQNLPPQFQDSFLQGLQQGTSFVSIIIGMFFLILVSCAVATFGGLLGIRIFRPLRMMAPAAWPPPGQYPWPPFYGPGPGQGQPPGPSGGAPPAPSGYQNPTQEPGTSPETGRPEEGHSEEDKKGPGEQGPNSGGSIPPGWGGP